jgi:hypothetical protein
MTSQQQFSPLCDLHHTAMERVMVEADSEDVCSYHVCVRPNCTRVFNHSNGYLDRIDGEFDDSRSSVQRCPSCGSILYLAAVDHTRKIETWECPQVGCDFTQDHSSPSAR